MLSLILPLVTFIYLSNPASPAQSATISPTVFSPQIVSAQQTKSSIVPGSADVPPTVFADNTTSSPSPKFDFMPILVAIWLIGVGIFSVRLMGGVWTVHLYKTRRISAVESHWQTKFNELCETLQIKRKVRFLQSQLVEMPVVIGWLKPVVLVPASVFLQISPNELETILLHELTHVKRHDYLINLLQSVVEILFFYHPCVWWISAKIRAEREFAVDEFVSQMFEKERFVYAKALASLEEIRSIPNTNLAMAANGGNLMKRIENILNGSRKINSKNVSIWSAVFAVTLILGLTVGVYWVEASVKTPKRIAIVFTDISNEKEMKPYQHLLDLQNKFEIPATWILGSGLIESLKQDNSSSAFFRQAKENRSDLIINVPNINYTIFMNGDDEYIDLWKKRVQFIAENMANNGQSLSKYSINYKSQIPQEMENALIKKGLKQTEIPFQIYFYSGFRFSFVYEKDCNIIENKPSCKEQSDEKRREIREKYLQYMNEMFELTEQYSQEKFGDSAPQILTLPTDTLTQDAAADVLQMLKNKGYEFVPLDEVISDEKFKNLIKISFGDTDFFTKQQSIKNKYFDKPFSSSKEKNDAVKKAEKNLPKTFDVEVTTKDLKPKPQ